MLKRPVLDTLTQLASMARIPFAFTVNHTLSDLRQSKPWPANALAIRADA
jgi:hypothetical protein